MKRLLLVLVVGALMVVSLSAVSAQEEPADPPVSEIVQLLSDNLGVDVETLQTALQQEGASMASVIEAAGGDVASIQTLIVTEIMTNHPDIDQTVVETHVSTLLYTEREAAPEGMGEGGPQGEGGTPPDGGAPAGGGEGGGTPPEGGAPGGAPGGEGGTPPEGAPEGMGDGAMPGGSFLRGTNILTIVADAEVLNVYADVLQVALQDEGATLASVIETYGGDVDTILAAIVSKIIEDNPEADATQVTELVTTMLTAEDLQLGSGPGGMGGPGGGGPGGQGGPGAPGGSGG